MKPFEAARLRLDRAKKHGVSLAKIWNDIPNGSLLSLRIRVDVPTGQGVIEGRAVTLPDDFSLLLGEQLYQLRSALDSCVYQAVIYTTGNYPPLKEGSLGFPICPSRTEFTKQAERRLSQLPQNIQDDIERVQPYNTPAFLPPEEMVKNINRSLDILNDLARKDRHRKLHVVGSWPYQFSPQFTFVPPGVTVHDLRIMPPGLLGEDSVLSTFQLQGWSGVGNPPQVNPWLRTQIGCNEPPLRSTPAIPLTEGSSQLSMLLTLSSQRSKITSSFISRGGITESIPGIGTNFIEKSGTSAFPADRDTLRLSGASALSGLAPFSALIFAVVFLVLPGREPYGSCEIIAWRMPRCNLYSPDSRFLPV